MRWKSMWAALCCGIMLAGCASVPCGLAKLKQAALDAALSPETMIPGAAAGLIAAAQCDGDISDWATGRTPVFGSQENADRYSDHLAAGARLSSIATALVVPEQGGGFGVRTKGKLLLLGMAARSINDAGTGALKKSAQRWRPDNSDRMSFPSAHSSDGAISATLALRNVEYLPLSRTGKIVVRAGILSLSAGTAWARVEAGKHYVTDVLAGTALGNFFGNFLYNAFAPDDYRINVLLLGNAAYFVVRVAFM